MPVWLLALVVVIGGCNKLFDLEPVDPNKQHDAASVNDTVMADSPLPCTPSGFDEDNDGLDDACDGCPTVPSTSSDVDGDGLPDECDDSATTEDEIKAFWTFSASTDSSNLARSTNAVLDNTGKGALLLAAGAFVRTNDAYLPTRIEVLTRGGSATSMAATFTVSLPSLVSCEVVAQTCAGLSGSTCVRVVPSSNGGAMLGTPISALRKVKFYEAGTARCDISNGSANVGATGSTLFVSSQLELATNGNLAIYVDSVVIYGLK